jgi:hypothetical protein
MNWFGTALGKSLVGEMKVTGLQFVHGLRVHFHAEEFFARRQIFNGDVHNKISQNLILRAAQDK